MLSWSPSFSVRTLYLSGVPEPARLDESVVANRRTGLSSKVQTPERSVRGDGGACFEAPLGVEIRKQHSLSTLTFNISWIAISGINMPSRRQTRKLQLQTRLRATRTFSNPSGQLHGLRPWRSLVESRAGLLIENRSTVQFMLLTDRTFRITSPCKGRLTLPRRQRRCSGLQFEVRPAGDARSRRWLFLLHVFHSTLSVYGYGSVHCFLGRRDCLASYGIVVLEIAVPRMSSLAGYPTKKPPENLL